MHSTTVLQPLPRSRNDAFLPVDVLRQGVVAICGVVLAGAALDGFVLVLLVARGTGLNPAVWTSYLDH